MGNQETPNNNSLEDVQEEDQDELLFESTFSYQDNKAEDVLKSSFTEQEEEKEEVKIT